MDIPEAMEKIRTLGGRRTKIREGVLQALAGHGELASAADVLDCLKRKRIRADRTTVYRELGFLKDAGLIREVAVAGRAALYEIEGEHHHHLICTECASVKPVKMPDHLAKHEKAIAVSEKFLITSHALEFYGLCAKCRA